MSIKKLAPTKNRYQIMLWTYLDRRSKMRLKYPDQKQYEKASFKVCSKIKTLKNAIARIEKKEKFMEGVRQKIIDYNGVDVRSLPPQMRDVEKINSRYCFYKYCIENGVRGNYIGNWIGFGSTAAIRGRVLFTRSFKTNKSNLDFWHSFVQFMKREN